MKLFSKQLAITSAALLMVAALALPGMAQMREHHGRSGHLFFVLRAAQLTDAQKAQVKTIVQNNQQANQQIIAQLQPLRQQLNHDLFTSGTVDQNLVGQIAALQSQLEQSRLNTFQQVWSQVLNATQQGQVAAAYQQFQSNQAQRKTQWQSRQPHNS